MLAQSMPVALLTQQMNRSNIVYYILFSGAGPGNITTISPVSSLPTRFWWSKATTSSHGMKPTRVAAATHAAKCTTTTTYAPPLSHIYPSIPRLTVLF
ncbi:hypothetical protein Bca52824_034828 [Brassica carinata]|uniref:Uncharacterized protein n=1 Tax=Brassica carinata TaxID=52824 RepID=A0A8X7V3J8_BRACI|nr:hypothetical protein Bca52824_034828 [Brassica carinata]